MSYEGLECMLTLVIKGAFALISLEITYIVARIIWDDEEERRKKGK